jgi:hypothetical protein
MDCVVSPVDHVFPEAEEDVRVTLPPVQKVVGPLALIVGVAGVGFTVIPVAAEDPDEHPPFITCTE